MEHYRQNLRAFAAFFVPSAGWLLVFFVVPLAIIFVYSVSETISLTEIKTTWTFENYARLLEPEILTLFWRSLWLAGISTVICLCVGYPVALVIATAPAKVKPWLLLLIILPFWTNLLIRTYALLNILGTRGRLNGLLEWIWTQGDRALTFIGLGAYDLIGEDFEPITFLGRWSGVIIGLVYVHLPFAILPIYASLEKLDRSYLEASLDLGAGQWRTFRSILLPMTMAGVMTAAIITFIPMLGSFLTPALLGRGQVDMIANVIERQFKGANELPFGSAMSLFLLYVTFIILAIQSFAASRGSRRGIK
ncbi:ABC transporter permease [Alphaproteobacteria bacterium KMM 3653]|uniref:ABC transporter permease n=1 Tax=Harenicola maris TaxID=2841044 RepID=A0AAP2G9B7_9RHOB|nr:ABC transporter permease [Harenicola maris]